MPGSLTFPLGVTRSPWGARSRFGALAFLVTASLAIPPVAGDEPVPLPWRVGGRVGFTVDAAAFPDSAGWSLEVYVRIPPATLDALTRGEDGSGRIGLLVRQRSPFGGKWTEDHHEFTILPGDTAGGFGKVVAKRYPTRPGVQRLQVRLEDLLSQKAGIVYFGRNAHEGATLEGEFTVPRPAGDRALSDIEFVWAEPEGAARAFLRAGRARLPNPERLYGLFASELRAAFAARSGPDDRRAWRWVARVEDSGGRVVAAHESTGVAGPRLEGAVALDLSTLPAGGYDLEVKAWQEGDTAAMVRRSHFSVGWRTASWLRNPLEIEDDVHFLLGGEEEQRFAGLQPGEQERHLDDFWRRRDPTPETARNEARELFQERVDHANRLYTRPGFLRGMFSDMGRVYIRYGEPTDVSHQVIPAGAETVQQVLEQLEAQDERPTGDVHQKGIGSDLRPFEIWTYEAPIPPPVDADPEVREVYRQKRLLFLFVDEQGLGYYKLRYSTE
jgi:GWxTD domain-containing protein